MANFNPRARVGRDERRSHSRARDFDFNPRARVGRDDSCRGLCRFSGISIHAPAWGATLNIQPIAFSVRFQSTRPRGARLVSCVHPASPQQFQSTRPRGARHRRDDLPVFPQGFQSTRPRGARRVGVLLARRCPGFQSTRPRGARRLFELTKSHLYKISIHAPAWGATCGDQRHRCAQHISIHAPAWGATAAELGMSPTTVAFQSTRPRGARHSHPLRFCRLQHFNPRARVGRDGMGLPI